jgi:AraC-like DNA-binding protein
MGGFNLVCELTGAGDKHVMEVLFSRSEPPDLTPYQRAFGVTLRFDAEQTAILLPRELLDHPVTGADAELRKVLEERVAALWHAGGLDTVTRLRRLLRVALLSGQVTAPEISARMGMSRRTLHRRLAAWGLRFQELLDETRCEFAQQLLANTRLSIGEIALLVGYTDPSVLTRGFVRWTGVPPSEWRSNIDTGPPCRPDGVTLPPRAPKSRMKISELLMASRQALRDEELRDGKSSLTNPGVHFIIACD